MMELAEKIRDNLILKQLKLNDIVFFNYSLKLCGMHAKVGVPI